MITSKTFNTTVGVDFFDAPELAFVTLIRVCREGTGYNITDGSPGNREARYIPSLGRVQFRDPFAATHEDSVGGPVITSEKVFVKYKF